MYTKHLLLLKIRSAAATLCAALFLCACSNEIGTGDDGSVGEGRLTTVTLSVGLASNGRSLATKGLSDNQENAIYTLYILAFQSDGTGTFRLTYYATGKPDSGGSGKFNFTLRCSVSGVADTKLLLIANQNPYLSAQINMTYDDVQAALTTGELGTAPAFANIGIPMFGFAGNTSTLSSPDTPLEITDKMQLSAKLLRAVARVDVGVGTYNAGKGDWTKGSVNFNLTEVYVFKPQNMYSLLPLRSNLGYAVDGTPSVTAPSPAGQLGTINFEYKGSTITSDTYCKAEIYIPEVALQGGKVYDGSHNKRIALVIGGMYKGQKNYYRIDFTTAPTNVSGTLLHDVLRNHIYRYTITKVNAPRYATAEDAYAGQPVGLNFTATITDWVDGPTTPITPYMYVRMDYNGENGRIIQGNAGTVLAKKQYWISDGGREMTGLAFNYNTWQGEALDNLYTGYGNGGYYSDVANAFEREGPFPKLVIASDNASESSVWKTGSDKKNRVLNAKKACWDYRGQGRSDWRLPRLSELYLMWLNRVEINSSKGFTSLGTSSTGDVYWSATEVDGNNVYSINAAGLITTSPKTSAFKVRCVREVHE